MWCYRTTGKQIYQIDSTIDIFTKIFRNFQKISDQEEL